MKVKKTYVVNSSFTEIKSYDYVNGWQTCNLIERLQVAIKLIWTLQRISFFARLILCARIIILLLAQAMKLPQRIVSRLCISISFR